MIRGLKKWITCAGMTWRSFKSRLTSDYIMKPKPNIKHSWVKYPYLDKKVWKKIMKSRSFEEFMVSTNCIF